MVRLDPGGTVTGDPGLDLARPGSRDDAPPNPFWIAAHALEAAEDDIEFAGSRTNEHAAASHQKNAAARDRTLQAVTPRQPPSPIGRARRQSAARSRPRFRKSVFCRNFGRDFEDLETSCSKVAASVVSGNSSFGAPPDGGFMVPLRPYLEDFSRVRHPALFRVTVRLRNSN
jgi:hypothetical protein